MVQGCYVWEKKGTLVPSSLPLGQINVLINEIVGKYKRVGRISIKAYWLIETTCSITHNYLYPC